MVHFEVDSTHVQTISRYERGVQVPKLKVAEAWRSAYGLRPAWLFSGDGPMLNSPEDIVGKVHYLLAPLTAEERRRVLESLLKEG